MREPFSCSMDLSMEGVVWAETEKEAREKFARICFFAMTKNDDDTDCIIHTSQIISETKPAPTLQS